MNSFWPGRRVLVTGHTGFKGGWLVLLLHRLGARVSGYALPAEERSLYRQAGIAELLEAEWLEDLRDESALRRALLDGRPEVVIHLAARALVRESYDQPIETFDTNILGSARLLQALRFSTSTKACVMVTSDKVYENYEWPHPYRESDSLGGRDPYSASKAAMELVVAAMRQSFFSAGNATGIATARAGNVIGGGDWAKDRLLPDIAESLANDEPMLLRHPEAVRPWQHVLEPLTGYLRLARCLIERPGEFREAWNFGPWMQQRISVGEVLSRSRHYWDGVELRVQRVDDADKVEHQELNLDISKSVTRLGWRPRLDFDEALAWTLGWYRRYYREDGTGSAPRAHCLEQIEDYLAMGESER
ncbi:MAG TPA: CDP-glucose 4,6-dehydratase [Chromatiaceae bacterium]|nr:CDP-glucose 4,6-dehydratase [Chromatiaceae bacterium]